MPEIPAGVEQAQIGSSSYEYIEKSPRMNSYGQTPLLLLALGCNNNASVGLNALRVCGYAINVLEIRVNDPSLSRAHSFHCYLTA